MIKYNFLTGGGVFAVLLHFITYCTLFKEVLLFYRCFYIFLNSVAFSTIVSVAAVL